MANRSASAPRAAPAYVEPMKALGSAVVPTGEWRSEIKFDGFRAIAVRRARRVELWSRNHKPLGADFPEVVAALAKLDCREAVLDGEIVAVDAQGRSRFQSLQGRAEGERPDIVYYVFDVLQLDGCPMMGRPLEERQAVLTRLLRGVKPPLRQSAVFTEPPVELLAAARRQQLEGIIAKRPGSLYEPGRRSGAWLKCKVLGEQEFVIGGFTAPQRSRSHFGALLVGYHHDGALRYAGKVGTGFDTRTLAALHEKLLRRRRASCPFADFTPEAGRTRWSRGPLAAVTWVKPELVAQVRFAEWTADGLLRQPVYLGLRKDKAAGEVTREPASVV